MAQQIVPLGGNTFSNTLENLIDTNGISNWKSNADTFVTYLRVGTTGRLNLAVEAAAEAPAILQITFGDRTEVIHIRKGGAKYYDAGWFGISDTGYQKIILKALSASLGRFPDIKTYKLRGAAVDQKIDFVRNNEGNFFYWGRRGPSVHLNYLVDDSVKVKWFYNELTVPVGEDKQGSYFMANGFAEGYFGIQVNSPTERRVLFSVWSPFETDDPTTIPDSLRIRLIKKGDGVYAGEFGDEGSGGQSFFRYNWKAGELYRFLVRAEQGLPGHTIFSAYFFIPEKNEWQQVASFDRPKTSASLKRLHSFLENFLPETGNQHRKVLFGNQWICDDAGHWTAITRARFTADNTARSGFRKDYAGGVVQQGFFLENCGFFNYYTPINRIFESGISGKIPESVYLLMKQFP